MHKILFWSRFFVISISFVMVGKIAVAGCHCHCKKYSISCNISPKDAVVAGAMWRLNRGNDTKWHTPSEVVSGLCPGKYKIKFKNIYGWIPPSPIRVRITNSDVSVSAMYKQILSYGSVRINIVPDEVVDAGAEWKIIHGPDNIWHKSGEVVGDIYTGKYKVRFKRVYGWQKPKYIVIDVDENQISEVTVRYERITKKGSLTVNIEPVDVVQKGAWKLVNGADRSWHKSGETIDDICVGQYKVKFKHVYGWKQPKPVKVSITELSPTIVNVRYIPILQKGALKVNIFPKDVASLSAKWKLRLPSDNIWHTSGEVLDDLFVGRYKLNFKRVYGYASPKFKNVCVRPNKLNEHNAFYVAIRKQGNLKVIISPDDAVNKGAKWRFIFGPDTKWHNSGEELKNIAVGRYPIKYKKIEGFTAPKKEIVKIFPKKTTLIEARYSPDSVERFVVSDVEWTVSRNHLGYGEIEAIPNGVPVFFASFHCDDWQMQNESYDCQQPTAKLSFRLFSKSSAKQTVKVELYSVDEATGATDKLVTTLVPETEVTLDEDSATGGYSKYFKDFFEWDGKVNGEVIKPGFYKVKVSTQEGSNWEEEGRYLFSDDFRIIPAKYLRSPFVRPEDALSPTGSDMKLLGVDLEKGIISGLYPIYYNHDYNFVIPPPLSGGEKTPPRCRLSLNMGKLKELFQYLGLTRDEADNLIAELLVEEYIDMPPYLYTITSKFDNLASSDDMVISDKFAPYRDGIYDKLSEYSSFSYNPSTDHSLWYLLHEIGVPTDDIDQLIVELKDNGYISFMGIYYFIPLKLEDKFLGLETYEQMDIAEKFAAYKPAVFDLLKTAYKLGMRDIYGPYFYEDDNRGWNGHCRWWSDSFPLYEGPIDHGIHQQDSKSYFEGIQGGICHCGDTNNPSICETTCQERCSDGSGGIANLGAYCGNYGHVGHYWGSGDVPVQEDLIGYIFAPVDGKYKFKLYADDAASLSVGGNLHVSVDSMDPDSPPRYIPYISDEVMLGEANGDNEHTLVSDMDLSKGYYPIQIKFHNEEGIASLRLYWNVLDANNQDFIFTDPTFIQKDKDNSTAFEEFLR